MPEYEIVLTPGGAYRQLRRQYMVAETPEAAFEEFVKALKPRRLQRFGKSHGRCLAWMEIEVQRVTPMAVEKEAS